MERMIRSFLWGGKLKERKCHLVRWETVTKPKVSGGLGLRNLTQMNLAFMMKLGWRLLEEQGSLWTKVLKDKYMHSAKRSNKFKTKQGASNAWQGISKIAGTLERGRKKVVRNGKNTFFWKDRWLMDEPLMHGVSRNITREEEVRRVHEYWTIGRGWNWHELEGLLSKEMENKLAACTLVEDESVSDTRCWGETSTGYFSVKSAYDMINPETKQRPEHIWSLIWKLKIPNRIRIFTWLVNHKKIMSNEARLKRGFTQDARCALCLTDTEDVDHIFRKCKEAQGIWCGLKSPRQHQAELGINLEDWMRKNLSKEVHKNGSTGWKNLFSIVLWWIWKWRNEYVCHEKQLDVRIKTRWILKQYLDIEIAFVKKKVLLNNLNGYENIFLKWNPPPKDWCALNVDGCVATQGQKAGGGGVLRNEDGEWLSGFIHNIGTCTCEDAELWAVYKGLEFTWTLGYKKVELGIDSATVVQWLNGEVAPCSPSIKLVSRCQQLFAKDWEVRVHRIYREQNRAADFLTSNSLNYDRGWGIVEDLPPKLRDIIDEDKLGISRHMIVPRK